ncbi:MAG: hypothetical protein FD126_2428 [Elusimicrobia bacterium]|nr:MAG: hypothetical protein FD126_2428 [Elusimicrobiota bacterium]
MTAPASLKFRVQDIVEAGGLDAALDLEPAALFPEPPSEAEPVGAFKAGIEVSIGTEELLLQATLAGVWRMSCGRCLVPNEVAFDCRFEEVYPASAEEIDLTEALREGALLEIPQRSLCRADCRGLCHLCGKNLNEASCACPPLDAQAEAQVKPSPFGVLKKLKEL